MKPNRILFLFAFLPALLLAQGTSDIVVTQWNGSDFVERDVTPVASGVFTFNSSKVPTATARGSLTEVSSAILTITGGTDAVIGNGVSLRVNLATDQQFIGVANVATAVPVGVYNIVAYGAAAGSDSTTDIQLAIDAASATGGTVWVPTGSFTLSADLDLTTATGVTIRGAGPGSVLLANASTLGAMLNITGDHITLENLTIDGAYTTGTSTVDMGLVSIVNASDITIKNCWIKNSRRAAVRIYGDSQRIKVQDSTLNNNYVGVRSFSDGAANKTPTAITVDNCDIFSNWDRSGNDQTGGIKLEAGSAVTMESSGHSVNNCYIYGAGCLAIEFWGGGGIISHSTITNCHIFGTDAADQWGISFNDSRYCTAANNTVKGVYTYGLEVANACIGVIAANNNIDMHTALGAYQGTGMLIAHNSGPVPTSTKFIGNSVSGAGQAIHTQVAADTDIIGNTFRNFTQGWFLQGTSYVVFKNNKFEGDCAGSQVFLDGSNINLTDIEIGYCTFKGDAGFRNVWGYNNSTAYTLSNLRFHHNNGESATFTGYDSWNLQWDANELINVVREDNYTLAGAGKADWPYWASDDVPVDPFAPSEQEFSIPIASKFTFAVAANAGDQWFKIFSRIEGLPLSFAVHVSCNFLSTDNTASSQTFQVASSPYGQDAGIMKLPDGWYQGGSLKGIIYDNAGGNDVQEVWLRFPATGGGTVTVGGADFAESWILTPSAVTVEPTYNANHYEMVTNTASSALKARYSEADQLNITAGGYANFGATRGTTGYGIRDNAGTMEVKDSGGAWAEFATGGGTATGTNTGDQTTITGNAGTATTLQTTRTIGGSNFNGSANVTSFPAPGPIGTTTPDTVASTTLSATGQITSTVTSAVDVLVNTSGTTNPQRFRFTNTSGNMQLGVEGDSPVLINGSTPYDTVIIGTPGVSFSANAGGVLHMRLSATGLAVSPTTASTSTTTGSLVNAGGFGNAGAAYIGGSISPSGTAVTWTAGSGSPEGVVTAVVGSLYSRTDGGANTSLYVKESGSGNTGWVAK